MSDKISVFKSPPTQIPTADELAAGIAKLAGHVSIFHERSDDMFSASTSFKGQYVTGRGLSPRQALWALAKLMNALR